MFLTACRDRCLPGVSTFLPHKNTLFHTAAHFRGWFICGQVIFGNKNGIFSNEVNDLAHFIQATDPVNIQENEALIADSECDVSAIYMCAHFPQAGSGISNSSQRETNTVGNRQAWRRMMRGGEGFQMELRRDGQRLVPCTSAHWREWQIRHSRRREIDAIACGRWRSRSQVVRLRRTGRQPEAVTTRRCRSAASPPLRHQRTSRSRTPSEKWAIRSTS